MTALWRSKTLLMLAVASVAWMFALPWIATGDGTPEGARELYVHYSLGGVFALLVISLLASATGSLARERTAKRLSLTLVRPVRYGAVVLAKCCAITLAGAVVLALACAALPFGASVGNRPCRHVLTPVLPSVREEAQAMYDAFMAHPDTPEAVRRAKRETILRLLADKASERYETVGTNATGRWRFDLPADETEGLAVRLRFAGQMDSRQDLVGTFRLGDQEGVVSNITQAVLEVALSPSRDRNVASPLNAVSNAKGTRHSCRVKDDDPPLLSFRNEGRMPVMMRPRKDIELLLPADAFGWNLLRAYVELVSVLALTIAFGLFLSASLGRPVALFVAMVVLVVGEMSPSVVSQYPDELGAGLADRLGLALTRVAAEVTRPVSSLDPISRLAKDTCIERREVARVVLFDLLLAPVLLALLSGCVLPRKSDAD